MSHIFSTNHLLRSGNTGFDIILVAGQSNMHGRTTLNASRDVAHSSVFQFGGRAGESLYRTIFSGADPLHMQDQVNTGRVGPAGWFAKAYTRATGRDVLLVPAAVGGTSIVGGSARWSPTAPGDLYTNAITQSNLAIIEAKKWYPDSKFVGVIWAQGETDGDNAVSQLVYAAALKTLIANFRSLITGASDSWFVMSQMVPEAIATRSGYPEIDLAHKQVVASTARTSLVLTGDLTGFTNDTLHFNLGDATRIVGVRMAMDVPTAVANIGVPAVPSAPTSLSVTGVTATTATLGWSLPAAGIPTDYQVEYKLSAASEWVIFNDGVSTARVATVTGLTPEASYDFRVAALNESGSGPSSSSVTATPIAPNPIISYTFEDDTVGAAPAGITKQNSVGALTPIVRDVAAVAGAAAAGLVGKCFNWDGVSDTVNAHGIVLDNCPAAVAQVVTWKRFSTTASHGRDGVVLRAQGSSTGSGYSNMRQGYHFQVSSSNNSLRIYRFDAAAQVQLGTALTLAGAAFRWYRASAIGSLLRFEYSTDGVNWTVGLERTDSNIATEGGVDFIFGFGAGNQNSIHLDDITYERP
jgi:hypothetical protein